MTEQPLTNDEIIAAHNAQGAAPADPIEAALVGFHQRLASAEELIVALKARIDAWGAHFGGKLP